MKKVIDKYHLILFIPLVIIMIASFFCMEQAKYIKTIYKFHLYKQILWYFIGFLLLLIFQKLKLKWFFQYSFYLYFLGILLLLLVLFFGSTINGAKAWFHLGFINFQPSEFMKIALLLYLAKTTNDFKVGKTKEIFYIGKCVFIVLLPSLLVFLEPDTGAIILYLLLLFSCFLLSGIKKRWFILFFSILILGLFLFFYFFFFKQDVLIKYIGTSFFYRMDRIIHFQDKSSMQLNNALITIGNASIFGHGIQKSILYVPEFPTDFAFTLFLSIFGFVGGIILLLSYFFLLLFLIKKIDINKKIEYKIFIHGFFYLFLFQIIENIFMNLGLMPIMGIPLPFLSYGGSNMIIYFIFLAFVLNIIKKKRT